MTALQRFQNRIAGMFQSGYDAIRTNGKRKAVSSILKHEDQELKNGDRHKMLGAARDLSRNFALVAWAIRKHLDYVSMFDFQSRTGNAELDAQIETLMTEWQRPQNCDAAGRFSFRKMLRLFEACRTKDGDVFALKLQSMQLQALEADRIRQPEDVEGTEETPWINGVRVNAAGGLAEVAIYDRVGNGRFMWNRNVPASRIIQHGYFERFDQVRGISPLAAAINSFRDVYEGIDYALAKMKVEQLFALVFYRDAQDSVGIASGTDANGYQVDFGKGPVQLDLDPGDKADFLKSDNPGSNTREFIGVVLAIALKALDLPFNFYDESHTNFFGSRAAWLLYDRSCQSKRDDVAEFLRKITVWLYQGWIVSGQLVLPAGARVSDLMFEWVHRGMPWWDPAKEIRGNVEAIKAGLDNPYRICKEAGRGEFEENIDAIARAQEYARQRGVVLDYGQQPESVQMPDDAEDDSEDDDADDNGSNNSRGRQ
ncbi:MAG: phage portal protein [Planctomyces sp.]